jgi:GT2 family glycosyltransferase
MIAVPTAEMARRADFYDYFNLLDKPVGSIITFSHGQSPARNRNLMIQQALENDCTHVFFLDDDVAFEKDLLSRLLAHDKDIVTGLYFMRNYPHTPIIFDYANETGHCRTHYLSDNEKGLIEIVATGLGCCLIKTEVFKKVEKPWIRLGELELDHWCDDIGFFRRVREAGFKLHCDLDAKVGHMAQVTIWPQQIDGKWISVYDTHGTGSASVNQLVKPNE